MPTDSTSSAMPTTLQDRLTGYKTESTGASTLVQKYYDSNKKGEASTGSIWGNFMKRKQHESEIVNTVLAMGDEQAGYVPLDKNGQPQKNAKFFDPFLRKYVETDHDGKVMITNQAHVKEYEMLNDEIENQITKYSDMCLSGDEACAMILGVTMTQLDNFLKDTKVFKVGDRIISKKLIEADGRPDSIKLLPPQSMERLAAIGKLRAYVRTRLPFINLYDFQTTKADKNNINVTNASDYTEVGAPTPAI